MYIITKKETDEIITITSKVENGNYDNIIVDNFTIGTKNVYIHSTDLDTLPEGVKPFIYCYTPEKGFYLYVPPEPTPEPKTPMEELRDDLDKVTQEKNMLGMELISLKLADFEKSKVLDSLGAEVVKLKLAQIPLSQPKGGEYT